MPAHNLSTVFLVPKLLLLILY